MNELNQHFPTGNFCLICKSLPKTTGSWGVLECFRKNCLRKSHQLPKAIHMKIYKPSLVGIPTRATSLPPVWNERIVPRNVRIEHVADVQGMMRLCQTVEDGQQRSCLKDQIQDGFKDFLIFWKQAVILFPEQQTFHGFLGVLIRVFELGLFLPLLIRNSQVLPVAWLARQRLLFLGGNEVAGETRR